MADEKFQYTQALADRLATDPALVQTIKDDPEAAIQKLAASGPVPDTWVYRIVVLSLGLAVLITVVAAAILAGYGNEKIKIPEGVIAIGAAAGGALAGLLAPSPIKQ